jgi:hypothetical protein
MPPPHRIVGFLDFADVLGEGMFARRGDAQPQSAYEQKQNSETGTFQGTPKFDSCWFALGCCALDGSAVEGRERLCYA